MHLIGFLEMGFILLANLVLMVTHTNTANTNVWAVFCYDLEPRIQQRSNHVHEALYMDACVVWGLYSQTHTHTHTHTHTSYGHTSHTNRDGQRQREPDPDRKI